MKWLLLLLFLLPSASPPYLDIAWREPQTVRVIWSSPNASVCVWLDGRQLDTPCTTAGTIFVGFSGVDVQVDPGMMLELRNGSTILATQTIPPNLFPQSLTATKSGAQYHIAWQTPSGNDGCVMRATQVLAPCAPSGSVDVSIPPGSRIALTINGVELARILIPPITTYLPVVIR